MCNEGDSDPAGVAITNAETPDDLYSALRGIYVDDDFALDGLESAYSHGGFARYRPRVQEIMLRMREGNRKLPDVPKGDNIVDYLNWCLDGMLANEPTDATREGEKDSPSDSLNKEAKALAALVQHPGWTDKQIAEYAGCHVKSLYRMRKFVGARKMLRGKKRDMPRGRKTSERDVEAWDDTADVES